MSWKPEDDDESVDAEYVLALQALGAILSQHGGFVTIGTERLKSLEEHRIVIRNHGDSVSVSLVAPGEPD